MFHLVILQGAFSAVEEQAGTAFVALEIDDFQQFNLTAVSNMSAAAAAPVITFHGNDTKIIHFRFLAQRNGSQSFFVWVCSENRYIFTDGFVGKVFYIPYHVSSQFSVQINGGEIFAHMEAHIVETVFFQNNAGEDVFAAVSLHM